MERKTVLAFTLIFLIYFISSQYIWKSQSAENNQVAVTDNNVDSFANRTQPTTGFNEDGFEGRSRATTATTSPGQETPLVADNSLVQINNEIVLENEKVQVYFTNKGALINQVVTKNFYLDDKVTPVSLIPDNQAILQIYFSNYALDYINDSAFSYEITSSEDAQTITFSNIVETENGISTFKKIYTLYQDYHLDFVVDGVNLPHFNEYQISINSGISITERNKAAVKDIGNSFKFVGQIGEAKSATVSKLAKGEQRFEGSVNWAAVRSKYFTMCLAPEERIMTRFVRAQRVGETLGFDLFVRYNNRLTDITENYQLYLGPVDYDYLVVFGNGMEQITELGYRWLRPLATLFIYYLSLLHRVIPNYGVVIIVFALTLKILLTPLTNKAFRSTRKMQQMQPLQREIQAKFKNDMRRQQQELQKLYKDNKVSPLGGCLPLLLQMPIFFALYPILRFSIEFRQANFFGWLSDLSEPDPYWILPILMGIFMFFQQKMMQGKQDIANMDEKMVAAMQSQKMMMYIFPPFMVFIFSSLPTGLVLYWTVFNVLSIIQQHYLNKSI